MLFVTNYNHANIVSDLSVYYLSNNTTRLTAEQCYTPKLVEIIACSCKLFDGEIVIQPSFQQVLGYYFIQYPISKSMKCWVLALVHSMGLAGGGDW